MAAPLTFSKICQKSFLLADIVQLYKYQVLAFIKVPTTRKRQQGSDKFWIKFNGGPFNFQQNFRKNLSCSNLKEISRAIFFKTLVVQN